MKNKTLIFLLFFLSFHGNVLSENFIFETNEINILDNGNILNAKNGTATSKINNIFIEAKEFHYNKLTLNLDTISKYVSFWNSIFKLTNKELDVLLDFIEVSSVHGLCTIESKKAVSLTRGLKDYNTLNNYVKKLKDKNAIQYKNGRYTLHKILSNKQAVSIRVVRGR